MSGKILIVDDLVTNRIILKVKLNAACHEVLQAATGDEALRLAQAERPRLILLDMILPDVSGIEVCRRLRADPATRHTPIILISASTRRASRLEALAAGADDFLTKPLNETVLMARIRSLLRASQMDVELRLRAETCREFGLSDAPAEFERPARIGLVAGDPGLALAWRGALSAQLPASYAPMSAAEALAGATGPTAAELYVIAADLDRPGDGLRLIADLRARTDGQQTGLCLAMADLAHESAALALDLGASDLVPLPLDPSETALRLRLQLARQRQAEALRRAVGQGLRMAAIDPLTGLYNRRYALAHLDRIAARAAQTGTQFSVMVLDIDRFKAINDRYGHVAGDAVLETVAARLAAVLRPADLLARIGGEEFLVVLPDATPGHARAMAEDLCRAVAGTPIALAGGQGSVRVTLSAGVALAPVAEGPSRRADPAQPPRPAAEGPGAAARSGAPPASLPPPHDARGRAPGADTRTLPRPDPAPPLSAARAALARADAALLAAKSEGRNQVTISTAA